MFAVYIRKFWWLAAAILIILASATLDIHNAFLYHPDHGFDGRGHKFYIEYVHAHRSIPPSDLNWETHQQPLYYIMGAILMELGGSWKAAQYINTFVLLGIVGMVGLGLWRIFRQREPVLVGMLAVIALPMLHIFPAMLTNELLNTFFIISTIVSALFLFSEQSRVRFIWYLVWFTMSVILGFWTKISLVLAVPTVLMVVVMGIVHKKLKKPHMIPLVCATLIILLAAIPVLMRVQEGSYINPHIQQEDISTGMRPADFYYRLDWIPKVDLYHTQYYSLTGAAWNSFFSDGHNAITPFVPFHKKAFVLWSLGFALLPLCIYGFWLMWQRQKTYTRIMLVTAITMLGTYVYYNIVSNHYSSARLTYEMGIVLPYAFGLAGAVQNRRLRVPVMIMLVIQFIVMVSFYWIEPWWHVTNPL